MIRLREAVEEDARTIEALRGVHDQDAARIHRLEEEAVGSDRFERAQGLDRRAARRGWRCGASRGGDRERLRAAELELFDLRAVRDALLEPALVQREGMTIAAEVIPVDPLVGGDFFFVGDGAKGTTVMAIGDVAGKGLSAVRRSAFTRTALASVAPF